MLNVARPLFFQSKVPIQFWGECLNTATFLINRLPSPVLKFRTPYELLFGKSAYYHSLKTFGCLCNASSLPSHRTKFSARAVPSVFMGYPIGYKGYRLFNLATKQFFISRDVSFHEEVFPFASVSQPVADFPVQPSLVLPASLSDSLVSFLPQGEVECQPAVTKPVPDPPPP